MAGAVDPLYHGDGMEQVFFLGLDFGTESVRAVIVDRAGRTVGSAARAYRHGQIVPGSERADRLFRDPLPGPFALQHPGDWLESAASACREAIGNITPSAIVGVGVDFTSCTMLPCRSDGTPLCLTRLDGPLSELAADPHAWPKLWKHHGALEQAERLTRLARDRDEPWLKRYGGVIGLEWLMPKMLEVMERSPKVADAADLWIEAGDWFVWQLVGSPAIGGGVQSDRLARSTCQAGYKGLWSARDDDGGGGGYASAGFLEAASLADVVREKLPGRFVAPGERAGVLCQAMAQRLGLEPGTPVSAAIIDAHAGVPGAGVGEGGTLVLVLGTSGCHMLLGDRACDVPGAAGIVRDGILPGWYGYETGQAALGDGFDLVRRLTGDVAFEELEARAEKVGAGGVLEEGGGGRGGAGLVQWVSDAAHGRGLDGRGRRADAGEQAGAGVPGGARSVGVRPAMDRADAARGGSRR